jgi:molecular chaperone HtpG
LPGATVDEETKKRYQPLIDFIKGQLGAEVKDVRLSGRLKESAACLVSDEWALNPHVERLMQNMGRTGEVHVTKRVLELNPTHPAVEAVQKLHERNASDARLARSALLLYDQALLAEGSRVKDPATFAKTVNEMLVKDVSA